MRQSSDDSCGTQRTVIIFFFSSFLDELILICRMPCVGWSHHWECFACTMDRYFHLSKAAMNGGCGSGTGRVEKCLFLLVEDHEFSAGCWVRYDALLLLLALPERRLQTLWVGEFLLGGEFPLQPKWDPGQGWDTTLSCFLANWILQKLLLKWWLLSCGL